MAGLQRFVVLVAFKTLAELRSDRQRTYLGFLWWIFEPLFYMAVLYFVFNVLFHHGGPDYIAVLLCGLVLWQWFGHSISHCAGSIQSGLPLLRSVKVWASVFPLATFLADTCKFLFVLLVLILILLGMGYSPSIEWFALPVVLLVELVWACGVSMLVAAVVPFVPDLKFVITPILQGLFYMSAVFFTFSSVSPSMRHWLEYNPIAVIIESGRNILMYDKLPDFTQLSHVFALGLFVLIASGLLVRVLSHRYPKLVD